MQVGPCGHLWLMGRYIVPRLRDLVRYLDLVKDKLSKGVVVSTWVER
jgi:hypothetical protein